MSAHCFAFEAPEDIVLGPPKTAFASAAGPRSAKTFDSPNRGSFADDEGKGDRSSFRDRFREGVKGDRDAQKSGMTGRKIYETVIVIGGAGLVSQEHLLAKAIGNCGEMEIVIRPETTTAVKT